MAVLYGKIATINDLSHETGSIRPVARDGSNRVQVLDSSIAYVTEGSHVLLRDPRLIEGYGMAIAVEGATLSGAFSYTHGLADGDVSIEDSIHSVLVCGFIHHDGELMPVCSVADNDV